MEQFSLPDPKTWNSKRVLITGASGFIGSKLVKRLTDAGALVFGTSRVDRVSQVDHFRWMKGSFEDLVTAKTLMDEIRPDIIFHLSGEVTGSTDLKHVHATYHSLVTSTVNLLTLATQIGCERIVLVGSCREPSRIAENPNSPYAAAKLAASSYGSMFWECYQTPVSIVRTFVTYGPGQSPRMLIPHVIHTLLKNENPKLSSGKWTTDWIYIDDVIDGLIAASVAPGIHGTVIDLGTGVPTSVKEVVQKIHQIIDTSGEPLFGALDDRPSEGSSVADVQTTFTKLKWKAKISLDRGLSQTIKEIAKTAYLQAIVFVHYVMDIVIENLIVPVPFL
ncbi:MAG: NAD-dependent epimerase/dehydratase family protein [Chitinophagaceae bacterium]|nr:MAG: NAD-dependent epimerase/dehydratase family protein [Chitinophagaceae bacterium]